MGGFGLLRDRGMAALKRRETDYVREAFYADSQGFADLLSAPLLRKGRKDRLLMDSRISGAYLDPLDDPKSLSVFLAGLLRGKGMRRPRCLSLLHLAQSPSRGMDPTYSQI